MGSSAVAHGVASALTFVQVAVPRREIFVSASQREPHSQRSRPEPQEGIFVGASLAVGRCMPHGALFVVVALAVHELKSRRGGRGTRHGFSQLGLVTMAASQGEEDAEANPQVAMLQLEAAQLRSDVEELETAREQKLLQERQKWFRTFDADGSGGVDVKELRQGMKIYNNTDLDEGWASRLLKLHDKNQDGVLQLEEFDVHSFEATISRWKVEQRAKQVLEEREATAARRKKQDEKERLQQQEEEMERQFQLEDQPKILTTMEVMTPLVILASVLSYILPLIDGLQFSFPFVERFPATMELLFVGLQFPMEMLDAVPLGLGRIVALVGMYMLSDFRSLPLLVRFNLRQAVVLDLILFMPASASLAASLGDLGDLQDVINVLAFLLLWACTIYCVGSNVAGVAPNCIPGISKSVARTISSTSYDDTVG